MKQRAEVVAMWIQNSRSVVLTQRAYRQKYRGQQAPFNSPICHSFRILLSTGQREIVNILFINDQHVQMNCLKR